MDFRITGLSPEPFLPLFSLSDAELTALGMRRYVVDQHPGFPDRVTLADAEPGETVLLLNHVCQPAMTPYRASHAIFVREGATQAYDAVNQVPESMRRRLLSLRAYAADGMMLDAEVVDGTAVEAVIAQLFGNADVSYIHVHNAKRGCYACRIDRVDRSLAWNDVVPELPVEQMPAPVSAVLADTGAAGKFRSGP